MIGQRKYIHCFANRVRGIDSIRRAVTMSSVKLGSRDEAVMPHASSLR
jgi:hypothetical protein